jgi:hypothetical protein
MKEILEWQCEVCQTRYASKADCLICEEQGFKPEFKPGDIVTTSLCYGWFDGDPNWVANRKEIDDKFASELRLVCPNGNSNCFGPCCGYVFYYVVTAVTSKPGQGHMPVYHVASWALKSGKSGWTGRCHRPIALASNVPAIVLEQSLGLIGCKFSNLL